MLVEEQTAIELATEYQEYIESDPLGYCDTMLNFEPWKKQADIMKAAVDPKVKYISVRSGNGVGKTYLCAAIICAYLDTHSPGYAVISSASWKSVMKTVWPALERIYRDAPVNLGGNMLTQEWKRGPQWGAFCVSPDEPENFAGFRTEHGSLIIIDEASSLKPKVHEAIMGVCSAAESLVVYLGNPLWPEGPFFDTFSNPDWTNFHIDSHEVVDLGIAGLATSEWIAERAREFGEDSPIYEARVLGQFPESSLDTLVRQKWLPDRILLSKIPKQKGALIMGVDVARFGGDRTVFIIRDDRCVRHMVSYQNVDTMGTAGWVINLCKEYGILAENVYIDDTGLGGGVTDRLHELNFEINPIAFGQKADDSEKFFNKRAEMYWGIRMALHPESEHPLYIPKKYKAIANECTWPKYQPMSDGRIKIEDKELIKKRKRKSPDLADALALTYAGNVLNFSIGTI